MLSQGRSLLACFPYCYPSPPAEMPRISELALSVPNPFTAQLLLRSRNAIFQAQVSSSTQLFLIFMPNPGAFAEEEDQGWLARGSSATDPVGELEQHGASVSLLRENEHNTTLYLMAVK